MRKKALFFPVLAALMLAGCSNDEILNDDTGNGSQGEASYLAVNIVTPRTITGRAATDGGFQEGVSEENAADEGLFLFFNAAGNQTQTPQTVDLKWEANSAKDNPAIEKVSEAVIVIAGNTQPTQLLVILNAPADLELGGKTLSEVRAIADDYSATLAANGKCNPLVITNSTYKDGEGNDACATDITNKTFKDPEEAKKDENVVNVYVERVVAKVMTSAIGDDFTNDGTDITVDGTTVHLTPTIEGIEIANIAEKSYLFKSITGSDTWPWTGWNDADNYRSYWATCPDKLTYANQSWNVIDNTDPTSAQTFYVQENTSNTKSCVLVTATLKDENGNADDFVRWAGLYYTPENFLNQYCNLLRDAGFRVKTDNSTRTINTTDIAWLTNDEHKQLVDNNTLKGYEMTVQLTETAKGLTFVKGDEDATANEVNEFLLEKANRVWYWKDGKAYYFVNIEHFGDAPFNEGVVRNHIYQLNLKSLTGVGVAVFNPDETIIPEKPSDDLYYLAARINILKWKLVSQDVNFD